MPGINLIGAIIRRVRFRLYDKQEGFAGVKLQSDFMAWLERNGARGLPLANGSQVGRYDTCLGIVEVWQESDFSMGPPQGLAHDLFEVFMNGGSRYLQPADLTGEFSQAKKNRVLKQGHPCRCFYCNCSIEKKDMTLEHVLPKSKGGPDHIANLVLACGPCNELMANRTIHEKMTLRDKIRAERGHA